jgi:hypothetical protein
MFEKVLLLYKKNILKFFRKKVEKLLGAYFGHFFQSMYSSFPPIGEN